MIPLLKRNYLFDFTKNYKWKPLFKQFNLSRKRNSKRKISATQNNIKISKNKTNKK